MKMRYYRGDSYLEIDIDIASSSAAVNLWGLVQSVTLTLTLYLALTLTLSHQVLGRRRYRHEDQHRRADAHSLISRLT